MDSGKKKVRVEVPGYIRVYNDGSVERILTALAPNVPSTPKDPETNVASKDVMILASTGVSARLYLPELSNNSEKLPILVYFHGGSFCLSSAYDTLNHRYMNTISSLANVVILSVEYRLAPEHPLPAAYEDCWTALNWVTSLPHPWLINHGDLEALFIGGDSAGGNIAHNIAMRAGNQSLDHGVKILGSFVSHPYFLQPKEDVCREVKQGSSLDIDYRTWKFVYPNAPGGYQSPMLNPMSPRAPSLAGLGCSRVLVLVATKDELKEFGVKYYNAVKASGYKGKLELFEIEGDHAFHIFNPNDENSKLMFLHLASFLRV